MKKLTLFLSLAFLMNSLSAMATTLSWGELNFSKQYSLKQDIAFEDGYILKTGSPFILKDLIAEESSFIYYEMHSENCAHPEKSSEMVLVTPIGSDESQSVGVKMEKGCHLSLWVETKDLNSSTLFN
jgi:hypothetical protein